MKKVLIIDDDQDILEALDLTFSSSGFETKASTDGSVVLELVENFEPDVIILDIMLAGIDGRNITKKLKSEEKTKRIPIVMVSAHIKGEESSLAAGADAFLAKPFDIFSIIEKVEELVSRKPQFAIM